MRFVTHNAPPGHGIHVDPPVHLSRSGITLAVFLNTVAHNAMTTVVVQHDLLNIIKPFRHTRRKAINPVRLSGGHTGPRPPMVGCCVDLSEGENKSNRGG